MEIHINLSLNPKPNLTPAQLSHHLNDCLVMQLPRSLSVLFSWRRIFYNCALYANTFSWISNVLYDKEVGTIFLAYFSIVPLKHWEEKILSGKKRFIWSRVCYTRMFLSSLHQLDYTNRKQEETCKITIQNQSYRAKSKSQYHRSQTFNLPR